MAEVYTHGYHGSVVQQHAVRSAENSASFLLPHLKAHFKLLDVGCGPGSITRGFAKFVEKVIGVDSSEGLIQQAREAGGDVEFQVASAYKLPFEENLFDVVFAHQVLQHLANPVKALQEMQRVCKPGGFVAVREAVYSTMHGAPQLPQLQRWRELYMSTARLNGGEPDAGLHLKSWMQTAGFQSVHFTSSAVSYSSEDEAARQAWGESWAERTLHSFGPRAKELQLASQSELEEIVSAWKQWASDSSGVFVYVNGEAIAYKAASGK